MVDLTKITKFDSYTVADIIRLKGTAHLKKQFLDNPEALGEYLLDLQEVCADKSILTLNFKQHFTKVGPPNGAFTLIPPFQAVGAIYKHRQAVQESSTFEVPQDFIAAIEARRLEEYNIASKTYHDDIARYVSSIEDYERRIESAKQAISDRLENIENLDTPFDVGSLVANLKELSLNHEIIMEGKSIYLYDKAPIVMVNSAGSVGQKSYNMGRYCYVIDMHGRTLKIYPFNNNIFIWNGPGNSYLHHPHISSSFSICLGDGVYRYNDAMANYNFVEVMRTVKVILSTYNPSSPYGGIRTFKKDYNYSDGRERLPEFRAAMAFWYKHKNTFFTDWLKNGFGRTVITAEYNKKSPISMPDGKVFKHVPNGVEFTVDQLPSIVEKALKAYEKASERAAADNDSTQESGFVTLTWRPLYERLHSSNVPTQD